MVVPVPTRLSTMGEAETDHLRVPAILLVTSCLVSLRIVSIVPSSCRDLTGEGPSQKPRFDCIWRGAKPEIPFRTLHVINDRCFY